MKVDGPFQLKASYWTVHFFGIIFLDYDQCFKLTKVSIFNRAICESIFSELGRDIRTGTLASCSTSVEYVGKLLTFSRSDR